MHFGVVHDSLRHLHPVDGHFLNNTLFHLPWSPRFIHAVYTFASNHVGKKNLTSSVDVVQPRLAGRSQRLMHVCAFLVLYTHDEKG